MRRSLLLLSALTVLLGIGGTASAGYWSVVYDLAGSTTQTIVTAASLTDVDPVTGSFTIEYDTPGVASTPVTGARFVAGDQNLSMSQTNAGLFMLTGSINTVLTPTAGGEVGAIGASTITFPPIADSAVTGFIHCTNGAFNCTAAGFTNSVPTPQTPTGAGPFPVSLGALVFNNIFTATVAATNSFTSTGVTVTVPSVPPVTLVTTYVGKEVSRTFVPEPTGWMQLATGVGFLLVVSRRRGLAALARMRA